jgi:hypothetical protein
VTKVSHCVGAAQIATSIEYEPAPTPADLPDDMRPQPGALLRFPSIKAIDAPPQRSFAVDPFCPRLECPYVHAANNCFGADLPRSRRGL